MKTFNLFITFVTLSLMTSINAYASRPNNSNDKKSESGWIRLTSAGCDYSILTDDLVTSAVRGNSASFPVIVEESIKTPGLYRLINPLKAYSTSSADCNLIIDATDPEHVTIAKQDLGIDLGNGNVSIESLASYYKSKGSPSILIEDAGYYGKLTNGEIVFPTAESFMIWSGNESKTANRTGSFRIVLPERVAAVESTISHADYYLGMEYIERYGTPDVLNPIDINNQLTYNKFE